MADPLLSQLQDVIGGAFLLSQDAFQKVVRVPHGKTIEQPIAC
jgi:hypothetical protein